MLLQDYSFDDALIGVTEDNRAVYEYGRMVEWLMKKEGWSYDDACEWIDYNVVRALPYMGKEAPIIMNVLDDVTCDMIHD
jgi:hypothetical protein